MFEKTIKCVCGKKVPGSYAFCPFCGHNLREKKARDEELDKTIKQVEESLGMPFLVKFPFEKLVRQMTSEIEKQFQEYDKTLEKVEKQPKENVVSSGISINISSSPDGEPMIQVKQFGQGQGQGKHEAKKQGQEFIGKKIDDKEAKKLAKLPRHEPETKVRRLTDRVIYEIELPGVKNERDIIISRLENSIEIKAFAKDRAYMKLIPVSMPIRSYKLEGEKLVLELKP